MAARRAGSTIPSLRVVTVYVVVSVTWIAFSDQIARRLVRGRDELTFVQTAKGWTFIVFTAILLHTLISRALKAAAQVSKGEAEISLVLGQIPANIWTTDRDLRITSLRGRGVMGPLRGTADHPRHPK